MMRVRPMLWNPIISKEIHSRMRSWRASAVISAFLAGLSTAAYLAYRPYSGLDEASRLNLAGTAVFSAIGGTTLALILLVVPGLVGATISGERERQTLDLLLCTRVRPARIVFGKLIASLLYVLLLVATSVPIFAIVFLLGGVTAGQVIEVVVLCLVTALLVGSLAMLCSVALRRSAGSIVASYILAALLVLLPNIAPLVAPARPAATSGFSGYTTITPNGQSAARSQTGPDPVPSSSGTSSSTIVRSGSPWSTLPWLAYVSPVTAVVATFGSATTSRIVCSGSGCEPCTGPGCATSGDELADGPFEGWRAWEVFVVAGVLLSTALLGASVLVLRGRLPQPSQRWAALEGYAQVPQR